MKRYYQDILQELDLRVESRANSKQAAHQMVYRKNIYVATVLRLSVTITHRIDYWLGMRSLNLHLQHSCMYLFFIPYTELRDQISTVQQCSRHAPNTSILACLPNFGGGLEILLAAITSSYTNRRSLHMTVAHQPPPRNGQSKTAACLWLDRKIHSTLSSQIKMPAWPQVGSRRRKQQRYTGEDTRQRQIGNNQR